ncbi:putative ribonuclease H-like domain-containing protein [Tanacetum coccineum]
MYDKKNSVLFNETECLILSPDFKLLDESQVLLKVPRQNNMYSFNLKNVVPSGGLTCLFAKATIDESNLWHRRLGHVNFKTMDKLVRGNLVRGLPLKLFENNHTCVACQKGKQHKAPNRVLITNPHNKTPYELLIGRSPNLDFMIPFGCLVTILNTLDHLGKFEGKADGGSGLKWLFDIDSLTKSMNYEPVTEKASNHEYILLPFLTSDSQGPKNSDDEFVDDAGKNNDAQYPAKYDDIIFGSTKKYLCDEFEVDILKEFDLITMKTSSTPMEPNKALVKDEEADWIINESTTGGCQFLGMRLISWQYKKQTIIANSTTKAEYVAAANCYGQVLWIQNQMLDYGFNFINTKIYIDNESTIYIMKNPVFHSKTKHIEIRYHFIRDYYKKKLIQVIKIHTDYNVADLLTKAFDVSRFNFLVVSIGLELKGQTATGKEFSNPFMTGSLPKTIRAKLSTASTNLFWNTATSKTVNSVKQIHAIVDGNAVVISESSVRNDLFFDDEDGITCLTNAEIFENLALMGNLDSKKFLMYPRFLRLFLNNQLKDLPEPFNDTYDTPSHTKKILEQMRLSIRRGGDSVERAITTDASLVAAHDSDNINRTHTTAMANVDIPQGIDTCGSLRRQETMGGALSQTRSERVLEKPNEPPLPEGHTSRSREGSMEHTFELMDTVPPTPHDSPLPVGYTPGSDEGRVKQKELMATCTKLSKQVLDLEKEKDAQAVEILKLKKRVKKLERKRKSSILHTRRRIYKQVESSDDDLDEEDASKQGRTSDKTKPMFKDSDFDDLDDLVDEGMAFVFSNMALAKPQTAPLQTETPPTVSHEPQTEAHIEQILPSPSTYHRKHRKTQKHRRAKKVTELPQTSVPLDLRADEAVHKEGVTGMDTGGSPRRQETMGVLLLRLGLRVLEKPNEPPLLEGHTSGSGEGSMEHTFELMDIVPPTPHDSPLTGGYTPGSDEGRLKLKELMAMCTKLSKQVLDLEKERDAQAVKILKLKQRVKRLERKRKSSISHPSRRIYKQVESYDDDLDEEDASEQGRKSNKTKSMFKDSDFDVLDDNMENVEGETVNTATTGVSAVSAPVTTASVAISTAKPRTPPTTAATAFIDEDLTIAQTLVKMRSEKAKEKGVAFRDVEETPRLPRSTTTLQPLPTIDPKDKEEATNAALAKEFDEIQARMDADHELAVRLTHEEQEKYTIEERATLLAEYFERRKKQLAAERAEAIRNKPPTRAQVRNKMITYLKHMGKYTHQQLKHKTLEELQKLYQKEHNWINDFKPIDSEEDGSNTKKADKRIKRIAYSTSKQKSPKKSKVIKEQESAKSNEEAAVYYEQEKEELRMWLAVVLDEDETVDPEILSVKYPIVDWESQNLGSVDMEDIHVYKIIRADGNTSYHKTFSSMLRKFNRQDLMDLHRLVMKRFEDNTPEGYNLLLWGDLKVMFEPNAEDEIWSNQQDWTLISWKLYENCGVHSLLMDGTLTCFNMLVEKRYPLIKEMLKKMLNWKLEAESESTMTFELLKFIKSQFRGGLFGIMDFSNLVLLIQLVLLVMVSAADEDSLKKQKKDDEEERLLSIFKQIHINVPFLKAMIHMPKGAKVLKDLLSHKEKLEKATSSVKLSEEYSAIIQRSLPQKERDPGSFTLPCLIGHLAVKNALADLGASINLMPHSLF